MSVESFFRKFWWIFAIFIFAGVIAVIIFIFIAPTQTQFIINMTDVTNETLKIIKG